MRCICPTLKILLVFFSFFIFFLTPFFLSSCGQDQDSLPPAFLVKFKGFDFDFSWVSLPESRWSPRTVRRTPLKTVERGRDGAYSSGEKKTRCVPVYSPVLLVWRGFGARDPPSLPRFSPASSENTCFRPLSGGTWDVLTDPRWQPTP